MPLPNWLQPRRQFEGEVPVYVNGQPLHQVGRGSFTTSTFIPGGRHAHMACVPVYGPPTQTPKRDQFRMSRPRRTPSASAGPDADEVTLNDAFDDDERTLVDGRFPGQSSTSSQEPEPEESEDEEDPEGFVRPQTPPQGSNYNAWRSYSDLRPSHPVFKYPDSVREKMYSKGIDPVERAEMDKVRLGKVYGEKQGTRTGLFLRRRPVLGPLAGPVGGGGAGC